MRKSRQKNQDKVIHYDRKVDVFYIGVKKGLEAECVEIAPGINAEIDENGKVIGIEILNASEILKSIYQTPLLKRKNSQQPALAVK